MGEDSEEGEEEEDDWQCENLSRANVEEVENVIIVRFGSSLFVDPWL